MTNESQNCENIIPLLDCYHDGEVDQSERSMVDSHLANCENCQKELAKIGNLVASLKQLPPVQSKIDFADRIGDFIEKEESRIGKRKNVHLLGQKVWMAAAAVILLALIATQLLGNIVERTKVANVAPSAVPAVQKPLVENMTDSIATTSVDANSSKIHSSSVRVKPAVVADSETPAVELSRKIKAPVHKLAQTEEDNDNSQQSLVAISDQANIAEELGLSTDEDGLYAIKM